MTSLKIESQIPLSQSCLWQAQRHYFEEEGVHAWKQVPFFITSNPFIADRYARLIIAYLQDIQYDPSEPLYIVELGTGTGQFSYYCNLALKQYLQNPALAHLKICYIMTDFTVSNLSFWEDQSVFAPWFADGSLDYALLDVEAPESLALIKNKITLETLKNPLIVIGNYVFDSVRHDLFSVKNGSLYHSLIDTEIDAADYDSQEQKILSLKNIAFQYHETPVILNQEPQAPLLQHYQETLDEGEFTLPTSALHLLDFFKDYAPQGTLLISSDKGFNTIDELCQPHPRDLVFHGSFSFEVNFHALAESVKMQKGRALLQKYREGIKTNLFLSAQPETPFLNQAFASEINDFGPADYFRYHSHFKNQDPLDLNLILTQLRLSGPDPYVFSLIHAPLSKLIHTAKPALQQAFVDLIPAIFERIYPIPESTDHAFNLGFFLHTLALYAQAIPYYEASQRAYGERFDNCFNLGICYSYHHLPKSKAFFEAALPLASAEQKPQVLAWLGKWAKV
ncbi:MAG: hypothetical protein NTV32_03800 [Gammaproteobacteria bacterium]|nr:hypothetical protein [Gammaproteobacteria bacterium]